MDMTADQTMRGIYLLVLLMLVGSALMARRAPWRGAMGMALAWVAIFAGALTLFSFRNELGFVANRVRNEVAGKSDQKVSGQSLRIAPGADGHYWVEAQINGTPARFLIDSGATVTALSEETAMAAGLNMDRLAPPMMMNTANGMISAQRSSIAMLTLGPISASDLPVAVSASFGEVNVIGMNLLSRLSSWRVENGEMILTP